MGRTTEKLLQGLAVPLEWAPSAGPLAGSGWGDPLEKNFPERPVNNTPLELATGPTEGPVESVLDLQDRFGWGSGPFGR